MTTFAFAASLALIVAGVACVYWPAALIVAGVLLGACAWLYDATAETAPAGDAE